MKSDDSILPGLQGIVDRLEPYLGPASYGRPRLCELVQRLFAASLATEEGEVAAASIVLIPDPEEAMRQTAGFAWRVYLLEEPIPLERLVKYAHVSYPGETYLVVSLDPGTEALAIVGIAAPPRQFPIRGFWADFLQQGSRPAEYVRVSIRGPGSLIFEHGSQEILRCRGGQMQRVPPRLLEANEPIAGARSPVLTREDSPYVLNKLMQSLARQGRGGLVLIEGASPQQPLRRLCRFKKTLDGRSTLLGETYDEMDRASRWAGEVRKLEFWSPPSDSDGERSTQAEQEAEAAEHWFASAVRTTARLAGADGAIYLDSDLAVLGFGAIVPVDANTQEELARRGICEKVSDCGPGCLHDSICLGPFVLTTRGTKHQAAAAFVHLNPDGLSLVVSHDGDAAAFLMWNERLVYWRILPKPEWSEYGINDD